LAKILIRLWLLASDRDDLPQSIEMEGLVCKILRDKELLAIWPSLGLMRFGVVADTTTSILAGWVGCSGREAEGNLLCGEWVSGARINFA
jgi:hypothetical protein